MTLAEFRKVFHGPLIGKGYTDFPVYEA